MGMKRSLIPIGWGFAGWLLSAGSLLAQIVPDQTLPVNSQVTTLGTRSTITGGTERGVNLYYSFREFSVPTGGAAIFDNASQIQNILTRVTGSSVSSIDGLLKANGTVNLYLLNPKGILFGPNARLQIGGSFFATTANSFKFSDGNEFSATNPQAPPLLTVNLTPGLQTGTISPGSTISNQGNLIAGQDLTLQADRLDLQGQLTAGRDVTLKAQDTVQIRDTVTTPFLAQAGRDLTLQGNQGIDILALNHPGYPFQSGGNLSLISDGAISGDAHFASGGAFQLLALAGQPATFISLYDPIIYANGDVIFGNYTGAALKVEATGSIQAGNIRITTPDTSGVIPTTDPDFITLTTLPSVILRAGVATVPVPNLPQTTGGTTFASGTAAAAYPPGSIVFGWINTSSATRGNGGNITINAPFILGILKENSDITTNAFTGSGAGSPSIPRGSLA